MAEAAEPVPETVLVQALPDQEQVAEVSASQDQAEDSQDQAED